MAATRCPGTLSPLPTAVVPAEEQWPHPTKSTAAVMPGRLPGGSGTPSSSTSSATFRAPHGPSTSPTEASLALTRRPNTRAPTPATDPAVAGVAHSPATPTTERPASPAQPRRRMTRMATPLGGGGRKAERGTEIPVPTSKVRSHRPDPGARPEPQRRATCQGTTRSARSRRLPGATNRHNTAEVMANGGLATTLNGERGSRRSEASATTTLTGSVRNRCFNTAARCGCNSTATTRAPRVTSEEVMAPVPAPISRTRSPAPICAATTSRSAHRLSS
jgi:hypothetical protein